MRCAYCHNADTFDMRGGIQKSADELAAFCERYKNYYGKNGGVTLSGGEPLMQADGAAYLMKRLKAAGIGTALDTSGSIFAPEALDEADLVILDIKHADSEKFYSLTKHTADATLKTLRYLQKNGRRFWIRQVVLPGYTDSEEQIRELKKMSCGAEKIELLPFHEMGKSKWKAAGEEYLLEGIKPPDEETMRRLRKITEEK